MRRLNRIECVSEDAAISAFLNFVGPKAVLVGLDEDTVGVLVLKLKATNKNKFRRNVAGFTWWKRILKHTKLKHK